MQSTTSYPFKLIINCITYNSNSKTMKKYKVKSVSKDQNRFPWNFIRLNNLKNKIKVKIIIHICQNRISIMLKKISKAMKSKNR